MLHKLTLLAGINPNEPIDFVEAVGTPHALPTLNLRFVLVRDNLDLTSKSYITTNYVMQVTSLGSGVYEFTDASRASYRLEPA